MGVVAVALELEHAVDEMLEHSRPRDRAVLRHVADEDRRDAEFLRHAQQPRRRLAHLPDRTGRGAELCRVERLHGVDHADGGPLDTQRLADGLELGLGEDLDVPAPPSRSARSLTCATDSSPVTSSARARLARSRAGRMRSSVDLPTPGSPPSSTSEAGHKPASEHAVELRDAGGDPRRLLDLHLDEPERSARRGAPPPPAASTASSTSVPKAEQPGHFPNQRPAL